VPHEREIGVQLAKQVEAERLGREKIADEAVLFGDLPCAACHAGAGELGADSVRR
jgi:hypothetical protein